MEQGRYIRKESRMSPDAKVEAIIKNSRLRFSCYWLQVVDISKSGIGIKYEGLGILPLAKGDHLDITLDLSSKVFARPIHLKAQVVHLTEATEGSNCILLGLEVSSVEPRHDKAWQEGLQHLERVGVESPVK